MQLVVLKDLETHSFLSVCRTDLQLQITSAARGAEAWYGFITSSPNVAVRLKPSYSTLMKSFFMFWLLIKAVRCLHFSTG